MIKYCNENEKPVNIMPQAIFMQVNALSLVLGLKCIDGIPQFEEV